MTAKTTKEVIVMKEQDDKATRTENLTGAEEYAKLLKESKRNEDFYKLISVALANYADGVKSVLLCQNAVPATAV